MPAFRKVDGAGKVRGSIFQETYFKMMGLERLAAWEYPIIGQAFPKPMGPEKFDLAMGPIV